MRDRAPSRRWPSRGVLILWVGVVLASVIAGGMITQAFPIPLVGSLPPAALVAAIVILAASPLLLTQWRLTFFVFLGWIFIEDLIRKFAGNNLTVYAMKDFIYILMLIGIALDPEVRGSFRQVTGRARVALYVLITWALILSIPSFFVDFRLPIAGLRLDFFYVPLVAVGAVLARDRKMIYRVLLVVALLGAGAATLGIAQTVVGPDFLAPSEVTPGLDNLGSTRKTVSGEEFVKPSGPFVDPGRFGHVMLVAMSAGLAATVMRHGRKRLLPALATAACAGGAVVSGGRTPVLVAIALLLIAFLAPLYAEHRTNFGRAIILAIVTFIVIAAIAAIAPSVLRTRTSYYSATLDPRSSNSEWTERWISYSGDAFEGISYGGLLGRGTGQESLGKQYIVGGANASNVGLYLVESGYGSLATEWGLIGIIMWVVFVASWLGHGITSVRGARGSELGAAVFVLQGWNMILLLVMFFAGLQVFQNYLTNAFLWLFSGIIFAAPFAVRQERAEAALRQSPALTAVPSRLDA